MNVYGDLCGVHFPGGASIPSNILKSLITFCGMKATEITENLRSYLKNVESNILDLFRQEGKIEFDLQTGLEKALRGDIEVCQDDEPEGEEQTDDEELRMKFNQMDIEEDRDEDYEDIDEEELEDLKRQIDN